jgi:hypothetical protein
LVFKEFAVTLEDVNVNKILKKTIKFLITARIILKRRYNIS